MGLLNFKRRRQPTPADAQERDEAGLAKLQLAMQAAHRAGNFAERQRLAGIIRRVYCSGPAWFDEHAPTESLHPIIYCLSYPRSGATFALALLAHMLDGDVFTALPHSMTPFDKRWQPKTYPRPRIVKDHRPLDRYRADDCVLIFRDGRDCMASLAWMTLSQGLHRHQRRGELADFIRWTAQSYVFGSWAAHASRMVDLASHDRKTLLRYEALRQAPISLATADDAANPGFQADALPAEVQQRPEIAAQWGVDVAVEHDSMFTAWQANRGGSNWRDTFDQSAARALHETGATEILVRLGYEHDEGWWRQL